MTDEFNELGPAETRAVERGTNLQFGMHIVIAGGPVDGFNYIGPFKTGADAVDWARNAPLGTDWWIAPLEAKDLNEGT